MGVVHVTDGLDFVACWDGWFRTTPIKGHSGYLNWEQLTKLDIVDQDSVVICGCRLIDK